MASLAACTAMDVINILLKKRQSSTPMTSRLGAEQRLEYPQVLTSVEVVHVVEGPVDARAGRAKRAIELSATKYCPVNAMLSSGATEIQHRAG